MTDESSVRGDGKAKVERRPQRRKPVLLSGLIVEGEGASECGFLDVSQSGARLLVAGDALLPADFHLIHLRDRLVYDAKPVWHRGAEWGVEFLRTRALDDITDPKLAFLKRLWLERAYRDFPKARIRPSPASR